jgi:type IV pilus assembly protein PilM
LFGDNSALAVDIGNKLIKVVYGKSNKKGISIISYGICNTPKNSFIDGNMSDKREIINSISELLNKKNIKAKSLLIGIKGSDIIMRHIEIPLMPTKQLRQAVMLEVQQYLPMDPNEYIIDSKIIDKIDTKEKKVYNVLLVAAPKGKIEEYMGIADRLGLKVGAIDISANSIVRFFEGREGFLNKSICTVDIGYTSTTVTIIENGKLFLEKEVDAGIKQVDEMLEKVFANTIESTEDLRQKVVHLDAFESVSNGAEDPRYYYANNSARQIIDKLIDNIEKIINFYYTSGFNKKIDSMYVFGGGSRINGIVDYMRNTTNIDTFTLSPDLMGNVDNLQGEIKENTDLYANCISLLLRRE